PGAMPTLQQHAKMKAWAASQKSASVATGPQTLSYGGGVDGIGVQSGHSKVYLVFYGTQWGTQSTNGSGDLTFSGDSAGAAPVAPGMFQDNRPRDQRPAAATAPEGERANAAARPPR